MIFVVRHGERSDDPKYTKEEQQKMITLDFDVPLTYFGYKQAQKTGEFINNQYKQCEEFIIISTPFLRCVETALNIAKAISSTKKIVQNSIYIQTEFSEFIASKYFSKDIMPHLILLNEKLYPEGQKVSDTFKLQQDGLLSDSKTYLKQPYYPEEWDKFYQRIEMCFYKILEYYLKNFNVEKVGLIIVTHGHGVEAVQQILKQPVIYDPKYCSINQISIEKNTGELKLILKAYNEHLINLI